MPSLLPTLLTAVVAIAGCASATPKPERPRGGGDEYLALISGVGRAVIDLSDFAYRHTRTGAVHRHAEDARREHRRIQERVETFAAERGVELQPPEPGGREHAEVDEILDAVSRTSWAETSDFDARYLSAMAEIHDRLAEKLERDRDAAVGDGRALIGDVLRQVRRLATDARALERRIGPALPLTPGPLR